MKRLSNLDTIINKALKEDLGDGDHTTIAIFPENARGKAQLRIKDEGILAGLHVAQKIFRKVDPDLQMKVFIGEGSPVRHGDVAFEVTGRLRSILASERLVLNFMQRLSGIATETNKIVSRLEGLNTRILDTRKTTPNLRELEKYAVRTGGGQNHRMGLYDMIMIKDNHSDFAGGVVAAIKAVRKYLKENHLGLKIEVEVRNFDELAEVLCYGKVDRIMLDNFSPADLADAVKIIRGMYETEASGGITLENVREYAETGVDFISVGAITHHFRSLDMSLKAVKIPS